MNDSTRRYSRTLEEAFGPGHRGGIYTTPEPVHPHDRIVLWACVVALVAMIASLFIWG